MFTEGDPLVVFASSLIMDLTEMLYTEPGIKSVKVYFREVVIISLALDEEVSILYLIEKFPTSGGIHVTVILDVSVLLIVTFVEIKLETEIKNTNRFL